MVSIIVFLVIEVFCFYLGIYYANATMLTIGYALLLLLVFSLIDVLYHLFAIKCHVEIPISMAEPGKTVSVLLKVKNRSLFPAGKVKIKVGCHNSFQKKSKFRWITIQDIPVGEKKTEVKMGFSDAGCHEIEIKSVKIYSLTGLLYIRKKFRDFSSILIMPKVHPVNVEITESTRNFMGDADVYDDFRPGHDPGEVYEVREYREKDKLQSIHWKLSAKTDELMVKENSMPKACAIVLMLDYNDKKGKYFGEYLELVASISFCLMDSKCPHFVAWYSMEKADVRRIRIDDEESFYLFLNCYLREAVSIEKSVRKEYREKYKSEWYLHDICINESLEIRKNGEFIIRLDKKIEDECKKLELLL